MTSSDIQSRALELIEREDRANESHAEQRREAEKESRIQLAIRRIKQQDREVAAERARKEAETEAGELARELHELGTKLQEFAEGMRYMIGRYADLRGRLMDAERRAGRDVGGRWARTSTLLAPWFRSVFGGRDSLVGIPGEQAGHVGVPNRASRSLTERDPLAVAGTEPDEQAG